jgi:hypothetical protein
MNKELSMNFKQYNEPELNKLTSIIVASITDNTYFPHSEPMLSELNTLQIQHMKAMADAATGDTVKISIRNDIKVKMISVLKQLGEYVELESKGKMTPLLSSGFPLLKGGGPVVLSKPTGFRISPGPKNGEILMRVQRVVGAKSYLYQYTRDPLTKESVWETETSTRCQHVLSGLPLGVNFWFRMAAIGPRNQIVYTEPLSRYIS